MNPNVNHPAVLRVGIPEKDADLRYACGFTAPDPLIFLKTKRKAILVVNAMEAPRARRTVRGITVWTPDELGLTDERRSSRREWVLALLKREHLKKIAVPHSFPFGLAEALRGAGIRLVLLDEAMIPARAIKRPDECAAIRHCQQAAAAAIRKAIRAIAAAVPDAKGRLTLEGRLLTSERLRTMIRHWLLDWECEGPDLIVACGAQGADPHEMGHGPLWAGQSIVLDVFPHHMHTGYWGDMTRTVVHGRASPPLRAMYRAVLEAQRAVLAAIRPGVNAACLHRLAVETLAAHGFRTEIRNGRPVGFFHGTGHGVGLEIHEEPVLGSRPIRLRPGHVVTVEPGLYDPEVGAVRIEDTVVVTRHGADPLANCTKQLEWGGQ